MQTKAGGADKCNPIAVTAFSTLLAAADPCAQQDSADAMIDLAKQLNNDADMIRLAQIFAQQPRNTVRTCLPFFFRHNLSSLILIPSADDVLRI